jgi:hypothetical protein
MTIGSMVLQPGQSTSLESTPFMMHAGMEGPHLFRVHIPSNDPQNPDTTADIKSNWVP